VDSPSIVWCIRATARRSFFSGWSARPVPQLWSEFGGRGDDCSPNPVCGTRRSLANATWAGLARMPTQELDRVVGDLLQRRRRDRTLFSSGGSAFGGVKSGPGPRRPRPPHTALRGRVRVVNYSGSGIETTFTRGRNAALSAWCPAPTAATTNRCCWSGTLADGSRRRACSLPVRAPGKWGRCAACRRASPPDAAQRRSRHQAACLAQPFLQRHPFAALERRGARLSPAPIRLGGRRQPRPGWPPPAGPSLWMRPVAEVLSIPLVSVRRAPGGAAAPLEGKRLFLMPRLPSGDLRIYIEIEMRHDLVRWALLLDRTLMARNWPCCPMARQLTTGPGT